VNVVEEHQDVLQNIEFAIVSVYKEHPDIVDTAVMRALDTAINYYNAERRGHSPKPVTLSGNALLIFERVKDMCEYRLGHNTSSDQGLKEIGTVSGEVIVSCLRRIRKSVDRWNNQGGRQGYLKFVSQFVG